MGKEVSWPIVALTGVLVALTLTSMGSVQAAPDVPVDPAKKDRAVSRYVEGERHYAAGRYQLAVAAFREALELSSKPELHFNIANCLERAGDYDGAATSLDAFLQSGVAPEPEILRERIWRLKQRAEDQEARISRLVDERVEEQLAQRVSPVQTSEAEVTRQPRVSQRPAYYALAAGGVLVVSGAVFAGLSASAGNDADDNCLQGICTDLAETSLDSERRYALIADVALVTGLAAAGVGGYLWYRSTRKREQSTVQVTPVADTKMIGVWANARF